MELEKQSEIMVVCHQVSFELSGNVHHTVYTILCMVYSEYTVYCSV